MMMMNCFSSMVDRRKASTPYFQRGPLSEILTIANLRHAANRAWTCTEYNFRPCWMKLCISDNHYTTAPLQKFKCECLILPPTMVGRWKIFKYKMSSDGLKQSFPSFLFSRKLYIFFLFQKLKQKYNLFIFTAVDKHRYNNSRLFWRKFLNKFPAVYNRIECMSFQITFERSRRMFSK